MEYMNSYQEFIFYRTYSRWIPEKNRRETWSETVDRYLDYVFTTAPNADKIPEKVRRKANEYIKSLNVMPSMRALWSAGENADKDNAVFYNCSALAVDSIEAFGEALYILACGCGVGYSVEKRYVSKLPSVQKQKNQPKLYFKIPDSREGWKQSIDFGVRAWFNGRDVDFDYCEVRPAGAPLKTSGGYASGPEPLRRCLEYFRETILDAQERQLTTLEVSDLMNEIAAVVVVGGVRRSSQIALSDVEDELMRTSKHGKHHPRRYMANISAVYSKRPDVLTFAQEFIDMAKSGSGERGIFNLYAAKKTAPKRRNKQELAICNPCKPLNSLILTPDGYITFGQALNKDQLEVVLPTGEVAPASKPFKTGENKQIYRIKLRNGSYVYGTDNHLHLMRNGEWRRIDELQVGDHIAYTNQTVHDFNIHNIDRYELGVLAGWLHGDGHLYKDGRADFIFGDHEFDIIEWFENKLGYIAKPHQQKPDTCKVIHTKSHDYLVEEILKEGWSFDKKDLTWLYGKDADFKLGFLEAVFTADGSVRKKRNEVELYSTRYSALEVISNILREFGIYNYICVHNNAKSYIAKDGKVRNNSTTYKIGVPAGNFKAIGFLSNYKTELLEKQIIKLPYRYQGYMLITEIIKDYSVEDVYDITVDHESHCFVDTGSVAHNCAEVVLRNMGFCNLTEVIIRPEDDEDSVRDKITTAVWLGVLQSCFTYFPNIRDKWRENAEEERLLGVSLTGLADNLKLVTPEVLRMWRKHAIKAAKKASEIMGINMPAAVTTIKPSGTVSQMVNCASGLHSRWAPFFIRRVRISAHDPLFKMMLDQGFTATPAPENNDTYILEFPIKSPDGCKTTREDEALKQLEWYKMLVENWCEHNASCTIYVKEHEWLDVTKYVYDNFDVINGVSFFPYDNSKYDLAPYEEIDELTYHSMLKKLPNIDFSQLSNYEDRDNTTGHKEYACSGNACEVV